MLENKDYSLPKSSSGAKIARGRMDRTKLEAYHDSKCGNLMSSYVKSWSEMSAQIFSLSENNFYSKFFRSIQPSI